MLRSRRIAQRAARILGQSAASMLLGTAVLHAAPTPKAARPTKTAGPPKAGAITDANVVDHVLAAQTKADHEALAAYYKAKAAAEDPRIAYYDQLFRAYMRLEGPTAEPLQRHARMLLKEARATKRRYELLAQAHLNQAWTGGVNQ
jgi:hypothetical protein